MPRVRLDFSGTLVVKTPLHVGTGETRQIAQVKGKTGDNQRGPPEVAAIARNEKRDPYLPASTLKGTFRRLAKDELGWGEDELVPIFGTAKNDGTGRMGAVLFRGASCVKAGPANGMPYADGNASSGGSTDLGSGVFVAARTSIDDASGTAADNRLYFQEMVAPGAEFEIRLISEANDDTAAAERAAQILSILTHLHTAGTHIGKGTADGMGRIALKAAPSWQARKLGADGTLVDTVLTPRAPALPRTPKASAWSRTLRLYCDTPFLIVDSSWEPTRDPVTRDPQGPQLKTQRLANRLPLILGSSVSGALRARAEWLLALKVLRASGVAPKRAPDKIVRSRADVATLDSTERLFGVTGFKALLSVAVTIADPPPGDISITSVKLDRFSGAPIDGALFQCEAVRGVTLEVALKINNRGGHATTDVVDLADKLLSDVTGNGLILGHGGNKGFGWFKVKT